MLWLVFLLHAVWGAVLGLSVDEAHYLLYAAHPALSYFDHPPLVGWVQMPLVALNAPVAVLRLVPGLCWLLTVWGVHRLTLRMWAGHAKADQAALAAVMALALAPLLHVLGIGLLPDTLLMLLTVALMHQTWTLMQPGAMHRSAPWWVMGGLLGLAGLAKYTAVFTAVAIALCLVRAHGWRVFRVPALWGGMALAVGDHADQAVAFVDQQPHVMALRRRDGGVSGPHAVTPGSDAQQLTLQPTGLVGRPRSNSGQLQALTSSPGSHQMRDFLQVIVGFVHAAVALDLTHLLTHSRTEQCMFIGERDTDAVAVFHLATPRHIPRIAGRGTEGGNVQVNGRALAPCAGPIAGDAAQADSVQALAGDGRRGTLD